MSTLQVTVYGRRTEHEWRFPFHWEICPACDGNAVTSRHVECDGGGFTASEWEEQDEDFREDYLAGRYDQPCPDCKGLGRVQAIDDNRVTGWRDKIMLKAYRENRARQRGNRRNA